VSAGEKGEDDVIVLVEWVQLRKIPGKQNLWPMQLLVVWAKKSLDDNTY